MGIWSENYYLFTARNVSFTNKSDRQNNYILHNQGAADGSKLIKKTEPEYHHGLGDDRDQRLI